MRTALIALALAALAACSTPMAQLKKELGPRASSYLECDEKKLKYEEQEKLITSTKVKVIGCGKEATYKMVESKWQLTQPGEH
jgi:hypothetical protein